MPEKSDILWRTDVASAKFGPRSSDTDGEKQQVRRRHVTTFPSASTTRMAKKEKKKGKGRNNSLKVAAANPPPDSFVVLSSSTRAHICYRRIHKGQRRVRPPVFMSGGVAPSAVSNVPLQSAGCT